MGLFAVEPAAIVWLGLGVMADEILATTAAIVHEGGKHKIGREKQRSLDPPVFDTRYVSNMRGGCGVVAPGAKRVSKLVHVRAPRPIDLE